MKDVHYYTQILRTLTPPPFPPLNKGKFVCVLTAHESPSTKINKPENVSLTVGSLLQVLGRTE